MNAFNLIILILIPHLMYKFFKKIHLAFKAWVDCEFHCLKQTRSPHEPTSLSHHKSSIKNQNYSCMHKTINIVKASPVTTSSDSTFASASTIKHIHATPNDYSLLQSLLCQRFATVRGAKWLGYLSEIASIFRRVHKSEYGDDDDDSKNG